MFIKRIKKIVDNTKKSFTKANETYREAEKEDKHIRRGRHKKKNEEN